MNMLICAQYTQYISLEGAGAYGPLLLAPAGGLEGIQDPCQVRAIHFKNLRSPENPLTFV